MGHTPLQLGPVTSVRGKIRQQARQEEGAEGGECGNIRGKINPYPCLDASVQPVTPNPSSVKSKMSHLSSALPELWTFNCIGRT